MLTGENGILNQASKAKEETDIANYKEALDVIRPGIDVEKYIDKLTSKEYMDRYEEEIRKDNTFKEAEVTREDDETIKVVTKEGYIFKVTEEKTEYIGKGETVEPEPEEPPVYEEGDITFSYNPTNMTKNDVQVTITKNVEEDYKIEYSKYDTNNWEEYTGPVNMEKNGAIYARLKNNSGSSESYATGDVKNIDKLAPNEATIQIGEVTENSIEVTASSEDQEETEEYANSGIQGYRFSKDNGASWEPSTLQASGSYTFTGLTEDTEYNIKVKVFDNADNETITANATSQKTESGEVTASDIADNKEEIGKDVEGYETQGVSSWKIFYAGTMPGESEPHIYLISSDYIPYDVIQNSTAGNKPDKGSDTYPRAAYFSSILDDYEGSASVTDSRIKGLNNSYFSTGKTSTYNNMKSVAYMLDTKAWSGFAVTGKADYAIGGPTIEVFFKSYNQKYGTNYVAEATSNYGYKVGSGSASGYGFTLSNTSDPLYVITSQSNALAYWIASPSADDYDRVVRVNCDRHCGL